MVHMYGDYKQVSLNKYKRIHVTQNILSTHRVNKLDSSNSHKQGKLANFGN